MMRIILVLLIGFSMMLSFPVHAGGKHGHDHWNHGGKKHHKHRGHHCKAHGHPRHGGYRDRHFSGNSYPASYHPGYYAGSQHAYGAGYGYGPRGTVIVYQSPGLQLGVRY